MENDADRAVPVQCLVGSLTNDELVRAIDTANMHAVYFKEHERGKLWFDHLQSLLKEQLERAANAAGQTTPACSAPCPKCGGDKVLLRYIAPRPIYSGGSFVRNTEERMRHKCALCEYAWDSKPNKEAANG